MRKPTADAPERYENRAEHARFLFKQKPRTDRCFLLIGAKRQTILRIFRLPLGPIVCGRFPIAGTSRVSKTHGRKPSMTKRKKPFTEPFRRSQVVSPVPSRRRFGKAKAAKKPFDIYVTDLETGEETLAIMVYAYEQRDAIQNGKKRLRSSALLRKITYAAFTAVEVKERSDEPK
jgi:hypothetical protein